MWMRDRAFEERAVGWMQRLRNIFSDLRSSRHWNPQQEIQAFNALLQTDLAIRLFQHEHGRVPENLDELVPEFLAELPLDPYGAVSQPLKYRHEDRDFVLYSVGPFGKDDGGVFGDREHGIYHSTYDIDVETWTRP
jgi:hypothetical protein